MEIALSDLENILLFPGSLKELEKATGKTYEIIDMKQSISMVIGYFIPNEYQLKDIVGHLKHFNDIRRTDMIPLSIYNTDPKCITKQDEVIKEEIRFKAKVLGANAVIRFQPLLPYNYGIQFITCEYCDKWHDREHHQQGNYYMGIPVCITPKKQTSGHKILNSLS